MSIDAHLFRRESGRMIASLTRVFGVGHLALIEDVVQESFCQAIEVWRFRGVPDNPAAWLMATAKHFALDAFRRERTARRYAPQVEWHLLNDDAPPADLEALFLPAALQDDLLRMMFSCCDPTLSEESQVAVILHILCGFSTVEVAGAFLATPVAMEKRLVRAKRLLADTGRLFDTTTPSELRLRLPAVHRALYLLFNEGYHGASREFAIRCDLCQEAMRLTALLLANQTSATSTTYALAALMALHGARLPGRIAPSGELLAFEDQDRNSWDQRMLAEGLALLELSASGTEVTEYHLEAAIASIHATAADHASTDWARIIGLYDSLLALRNSPVIALNRAIAVGQFFGADRGILELESLDHLAELPDYPFYEAALGEFEFRRNRIEVAAAHFAHAAALARNPLERRHLERRLGAARSIDDATRLGHDGV